MTHDDPGCARDTENDLTAPSNTALSGIALSGTAAQDEAAPAVQSRDVVAESRRRWRRADAVRWVASLGAITVAALGATGAQGAGLEVFRPLPWFGIAAAVLVVAVAARYVERSKRAPGASFATGGGRGTGVIARRDLGQLIVDEHVRFVYRDGREEVLDGLRLVVVGRSLGGTGLDVWNGEELVGSWMLGALPGKVRAALAAHSPAGDHSPDGAHSPTGDRSPDGAHSPAA